jgi:hypothetical protein
MDPPFTFNSADEAGEMVELYWQALARDVPFTDYATSAVTQAAVADLNRRRPSMDRRRVAKSLRQRCSAAM